MSPPDPRDVAQAAFPSFAAYYLGFFRAPSRAARALLKDSRRLRFGWYALLIPLLGYVAVYVGLSRSGAYPSAFSPWLAIPAESYYRYNIYLLPPSMLAAWLLASAVVQLLGQRMDARGSFEDTVSVLGFAISIASWSLLPHDLAVSLLGATRIIDGRAHEHAMNANTPARALLWFFSAIYLVAFPLMFALVLRGAHNLRARAAAALGCFGFVVYQLVFVIFNR